MVEEDFGSLLIGLFKESLPFIDEAIQKPELLTQHITLIKITKGT